MRRSLIFDKSGKCNGCEFEVPGPSQVVNTITPCFWCERNPYLITEIKDQYRKRPETQSLSAEDLNVADDSNPARDANKEFGKEWGIKPDAPVYKPRKKGRE